MHGIHSDIEKANEVVRAVQRHRRKVGFGLEQGGCQLATPAANYKLRNDEEVLVVVPKDW